MSDTNGSPDELTASSPAGGTATVSAAAPVTIPAPVNGASAATATDPVSAAAPAGAAAPVSIAAPVNGASAATATDPVTAAFLATAPSRVRVPGIVGMLLSPYSLAFVLLLIGAGYLATAHQVGALAFNSQAFLNVTQVLAPLFLVSAFVERAVEVLLTGLRGDESDRLQAEVEHATATARAAPTPQAMQQLKALQHMLIAFKSASRELAFLLSTGLGIGAALCGIRGLAGLLATTPVQAPTPAFTTLDILLTGIVIGGGADGIHKIVQAILDFVQAIPSSKSG